MRFEGVSKRYPRGGPGYASLRAELVSGLRSVGGRLKGRGGSQRGALALEDISFEVKEGDSFAIVGANGAGKTTALKLVARISYPTAGKVRVVGRVGALIEVGSGIHPELSARENIRLYGQILGMTKQDVRDRFDEIVEFGEFGHVLDRPVKMYSSGMQLRLGFAIASHLDPDVFVVDEALAVGDAGFQTKCIERMRKLVSEGRTLVFVSHTLPVVKEICDRGILLENGRLAYEGDAPSVVDEYLSRVTGKIAARKRDTEPIDVLRAEVSSAESGGPEISTFDSVRISATIEVRERCEGAQIGIGVTDGRQGNLIALTMLSTGQTVDLSPGTHEVVCTTGSVPILPGSYEMLMVVSAATKALNYLEPRVIGVLVISEGPEDRKRDLMFPRGGGFGPVCVDFAYEVR